MTSMVKREWRSAADARVKLQQGVKAEMKRETKREAKLEVGRETKLEATKREPPCSGVKTAGRVKAELGAGAVEDLLKRGMMLRSQADAVKREPGSKAIKKEKRGKAKEGKARRKGPKRRASAARRQASRDSINREVPLSPSLAKVVGASALSRPQTVKRLWAVCRERGLLNPADKREILFDPELEQLLGRPSARMTDLFGCLVPHFDYAAETAQKAEQPCGVKVQHLAVKRPCKGEASEGPFTPSPAVRRACKVDVDMAAFSVIKSLPMYTEESQQRGAKAVLAVKSECLGVGASVTTEIDLKALAVPSAKRALTPLAATKQGISLEDSARRLHLQFSDVGPTSVVVECQPLLGAGLHIEAVAIPVITGGLAAASPRQRPAVLRTALSIDLRESVTCGGMEPHGQARLTGLAPEFAYRVALEMRQAASHNSSSSGGRGGGGGDGCAEGSEGREGGTARSQETMLPQRAEPARWTPQEVSQWCCSLQLRELAQKVEEYRIDGSTFLALGEEDLEALGLAAPFLRRRVLAALKTISVG